MSNFWKKVKAWVLSHRVLTGVIATVVVVALGVGGHAWYQAHQMHAMGDEQKQASKVGIKALQHDLTNRGQKRLNGLKGKYQVNSNKGVTNQGYGQLMAKRREALRNGVDKTASGYVKVPSVGISLPIFDYTNMYTLSLGATKYFANEHMGKGNYVLAGHNMDMPNILFSNLPQVKKGAKIQLISRKHVYNYRVTGKSTINPNQKYVDGTPIKSSVLYQTPRHPEVTLYCCNATGSARVAVQGRLV